MGESASADWLEADLSAVSAAAYQDPAGGVWYRFDTHRLRKGDVCPAFRFRLRPECFPSGCELAWYSKKRLPLYAVDESAPPPARRRPRSVPRSTILAYRISPVTLARGCVFELPASPHAESLFLHAEPTSVETDELRISQKLRWRSFLSASGGGRLLFAGATCVVVAVFAFLVRLYCLGGRATTGLCALAVSFFLAALWFDSPSYSLDVTVDKGDDSYYLAYVQNLVQHGEFFREPTRLRFGRGLVPNNHGMPGVAILLSPPALVRALQEGTLGSDAPLSAADVRRMRALSASYTLGAMTLLFLLLHRARPCLWSVLLPALLLWGTSLPKWTFVRSIFTHSSEMFLLCLALWLATMTSRKCAEIRGVALSLVLAVLILVRGEYLLTAPLLLFLCPMSPPPSPPLRRLAAVRGVQFLVLAAAAAVYWSWTRRLSTGYGTIASAELPTGTMAVLARFAQNAWILIRDYAANGGLLLSSAALGAAAASLRALPRPAQGGDERGRLPVRFGVLAVTALLMFLLNCAFTPPLGMEFQHRYSLKLYPLALLCLWTLLQPRAGKASAILKGLAMAAVAVAAAVNLTRLATPSASGGTWQNFVVLTNFQMRTLRPGGSAVVNLSLAAGWMLLFWCLHIFSLLFPAVFRYSITKIKAFPVLGK